MSENEAAVLAMAVNQLKVRNQQSMGHYALAWNAAAIGAQEVLLWSTHALVLSANSSIGGLSTSLTGGNGRPGLFRKYSCVRVRHQASAWQ